MTKQLCSREALEEVAAQATLDSERLFEMMREVREIARRTATAVEGLNLADASLTGFAEATTFVAECAAGDLNQLALAVDRFAGHRLYSAWYKAVNPAADV